MKPTKVQSFTLSEMLVVMVITVIVVGLAFSVLNLVQKQIRTIEKNYHRTTELSLLEQRLWQDFNQHNSIEYKENKIKLIADLDTVYYTFMDNFTLRNSDTIPLKVNIARAYYKGGEIQSGYIDAVSITANKEVPNYFIFVASHSDATYFLNQDGL